MVRGHHYHGGPIAKKGEKSWKAMTGSEVQIQMAKQTNTENHTTGIKLENRTPNKTEGNLMYMFGIEKKCSGERQKRWRHPMKIAGENWQEPNTSQRCKMAYLPH